MVDPAADVADIVDGLVARFADGGPEHGQPAVAWGVLLDRELALSGGAGALRVAPDGAPAGPPPDADSVFRIASMTKSFTATALLVLRDAGMLGLDDPVARHVPELAGLRLPTTDSPDLTLRHLLTMSGGLPIDDPWGDRQQGLDPDAFGDLLRAGLSFAWAPGTTFEYCNLGYAILGRAIAAVAKEDYAAAVRRLVLDPLGLGSTGFHAADVDPARLATGYRRSPWVPAVATSAGLLPGHPADGARSWQEVPFDPHGAFAPMGGLFSSVRDLARWAGGFADAFPARDAPDDGHPLRRATRREMQQQHRAIPPRLAASPVDEPAVLRGGGYGFGLVVEQDPRWGLLVGHSGGYPGFGSHMRWHPDSGTAAVVLASSTYAPSATVAKQLVEAVLGTRRAGRARVAGGTDRADGADRADRADPSGRRAPAVRAALRPAAPAPGAPWSATLAAMDTVEALLTRWDESAVRALVAENVDLDDPLEVRARLARQAGSLAGPGRTPARDPDTLPEHDSPAHARWWLRGDLGRVRLELRMTAHPEPLVQWLSITPVPHPGPALRAVADAVAQQTCAPVPGWPRALPIGTGLDVDAAARQIGLTAGFAGRCRVGTVLSCDGDRTAVLELVGERATVELCIEVDAAGAVRRLQVGHPEQGAAAAD